MTKEEKDAYYEAEAQAFVDSHPDYSPTHENQKKIFKLLDEKGLDLTRETLALVWKEMKV